MKRAATIVVVGALMLALAAGVALAALRVGNDLHGTRGDERGQDTLLGLGAGDRLVGRSAADQLAGGMGADRLYGNDGNDTLDGGSGEDRIYTGLGFDFVYAADGDRDYVNCNGQTSYSIVFDSGLDRLDRCPGSASANSAAARGGAIKKLLVR